MTPSIPNHESASLSQLDLAIASSVPPGGNWKNIPPSVPSRRLEQIRESYAEGKGSRSTYYGRLKEDEPSYTINTYFTRPGNGCHLHYDKAQNRTLSFREAARLQSFPDNFIFWGDSKTKIATQIGNAVPPLLALQIAEHLGFRGLFADLFAGAGGISLGFRWANWESTVANDIDPSFLKTYTENMEGEIIPGDITDKSVSEKLILSMKALQAHRKKLPFFILGGPPCQGFSTAGNRRTMEDPRNWLFKQFKQTIEACSPDGFIFENVPGLVSMERGRVFAMIKKELSKLADRLIVWTLHTEHYGIPQRRKRIVIIGDNTGKIPTAPPPPITTWGSTEDFFGKKRNAVTVGEALSDLPKLAAGEDGSQKSYRTNPANDYQRFVRGLITAKEYIEKTRILES